MTRNLSRWLAFLLGALLLGTAVAGCGEKPKPSEGGTYYDGPMKPKGGGGAKAGG